MADIVHVAMGGGIVFGAYRNPELAHAHARTLTGVTVSALDMDSVSAELRACIEVLDRLPDDVVQDLNVAEWNEEETPEVMDVSDIEDA